MLFSFSMIMLVGMSLGWLCKKIKLPPLIGMILAGILIGPYGLNLLSDNVLLISADLRRLALIVILLRAGLSLDLDDLKKVGRPAILMSFVPAVFEIVAMIFFAPLIMGISRVDAALLGAVVGAVSPAVIVPSMLKLMDEGYGTAKAIPQLILTGASVDDVFVIVIFSTLLVLAQGGGFSYAALGSIPLSIGLGIVGGVGVGYLLAYFFQKVEVSDIKKVIILVAVAFLLVTFEDTFNSRIPFAGLLAVMTMGMAIQFYQEAAARRLAGTFNKIWTGAEVLLFVLLGATVDVQQALVAGPSAIVLIACALVFRMVGVYLSLLGTHLNRKERLFCMLAYLPKATVQAAIGGIPLALGLEAGSLILTVSVLSILVAAPLGAFAIELTYKRFLSHDQ